MKTNTILLALLFLVFFGLSSCKKDVPSEVDHDQKEEVAVVPIPVLKTYLSSLIGIDTSLIDYDEHTTFFMFRGVQQINREKLTYVYYQNFGK